VPENGQDLFSLEIVISSHHPFEFEQDGLANHQLFANFYKATGRLMLLECFGIGLVFE